jgi:hypothetical protein
VYLKQSNLHFPFFSRWEYRPQIYGLTFDYSKVLSMYLWPTFLP